MRLLGFGLTSFGPVFLHTRRLRFARDGGHPLAAAARDIGYGGDSAGILRRSTPALRWSLKSFDGSTQLVSFSNQKSHYLFCRHRENRNTPDHPNRLVTLDKESTPVSGCNVLTPPVGPLGSLVDGPRLASLRIRVPTRHAPGGSGANSGRQEVRFGSAWLSERDGLKQRVPRSTTPTSLPFGRPACPS
jgi:hypothetical protein